MANADGERAGRNPPFTVYFDAGNGMDAIISTIPQPFTIVTIGLTGILSGGYAIEGQAGTVAWGMIPTNRNTFYAGTDLAIASGVVGAVYTQAATLAGALSRVRRNNCSWATGNAGTASLGSPMRFNMNGAGDKLWATQVGQRMVFEGVLSDEKIKYWENQCRVLSSLQYYPSDIFDGSTLDPQWTSNNQANMTLGMGNGYLLWTQATGAANDALAYILTPITGTAWSFDLKVSNTAINNYVTNTTPPGLIFKNSSTGKTFLAVLNRAAMNNFYFYGHRFNGDTYVSTPLSVSGVATSIPAEYFLRVVRTSTTLTFYTSLDGITFTSRGSETISAHLGGIDRIGIVANANNPNTTISARVQSFLRTS